MKFEKDDENDNDDVYLETGYLCDREDRICDETTFLISKLQSKLDETKVNNFDNMIKLADRVDHIQNMERLKNFEMVEKVRQNSGRGGEFNEAQVLRNILMQVK